MSEMLTRSLSGAAYVAVILLCCFTGFNSQLLLAAFVGSIALVEWSKFVPNTPRAILLFLPLAFLSLLVALSGEVLFSNPAILPIMLFACLMILMGLFVAHTLKLNQQPTTLFHYLTGVLYIALPMALLPLFPWHLGEPTPWLLAALFILIWCSDTFAYLVGSAIGKRKLAPKVSPNKSWEGFFGGLVAALIASYLFFYFLGILPLWGWLGFALIAVIFGTLGDLFESSVKRQFNLKDSGNFMPGHGGLLDRIDSILFALPPAYFYIRIIENYFT